ncbi:MAG: aminoglycoside phosphotransferase family protein [Nanoarchaeota archaeon]|nr:aminoglycoside phosphotransferase family protein [Nanoarchaeota archaeon]MBU1321347.1 aminoglycoside phosphotransferase family protein [Nanoarchaeota archaeon]MBU1597270.1 aminoglycoside phosphotransferase family protein [Nanoarchaeota archaeon]MBU2441484.1 aminoglycoside phosphotransferase family protein [Nanoarchaeota archaeon]
MIEITSKLIRKIELQLDCRISSYKTLGQGEHNVNFLLNTTKGNLVLRIYANTQFDNSKKEYFVLRKLKGQYAPRVYFFDNSKTDFKYDYMIQEFIEGVTLNKFSSNDLKQVAKILKEIHQIKDLRKKRDWKEPIGSWSRQNILQNSKYLGDEFHNNMKKIYTKVLNELEKVKPSIEKYERVHLIHDDVIPENIIKTKKGDLILVDWELATFDYFFFEFGCVIAENHLTKNQEDIFLEEYGFGIKQNEKKIIHAIKINRILSLISWLIQRIVSIKQGKQIFVGENVVKYKNRLEKEIIHIEQLLSKKI